MSQEVNVPARQANNSTIKGFLRNLSIQCEINREESWFLELKSLLLAKSLHCQDTDFVYDQK